MGGHAARRAAAQGRAFTHALFSTHARYSSSMPVQLFDIASAAAHTPSRLPTRRCPTLARRAFQSPG